MPPKDSSPSEQLRQEAVSWHQLQRSGKVTVTQQKAFQQWLARSDANLQTYRSIETVWRELGSLEDAAKPELTEARAYFQHARSRHRIARSALAIAASIGFLAALSAILPMLLDNGTYRTGKGEQNQIQLSDGSRIDLNTDTELRVSYGRSARAVTLIRGEALFSVVHDSEKSFQVVAAQGRILDIGTRFNVYRKGDQVSVTVLEGEVSVAARGEPQHLFHNQNIGYDAAGKLSPVTSADVNQITSWQNRQLVFQGQPLSHVVAELERYHDVSLQITDAKLKSLKVSGTFPSDNLSLALTTMSSALPIKLISPKEHIFVIQAAE